MATKPTEDLTWASGAAPSDVAEPPAPKKAAGWLINERPPSPWWNWQFRGIGRWIAYVWAVISNAVTALGVGAGAAAPDTVLRDALRSLVGRVLLGNWWVVQIASYFNNTYAMDLWNTGPTSSSGQRRPAYYVSVGDSGKVTAYLYGGPPERQGSASIGGATLMTGVATSRDTNDSAYIYAVGLGGVWQAIAIGDDMTTITPSFTTVTPAGGFTGDFQDIASDDLGNYVAVGAGGQVQYIPRSGAGATTPTNIPAGSGFFGYFNFVACKPGSPNVWICGGEDGVVHRFTGGDATWDAATTQVATPFGSGNWPTFGTYSEEFGLFIITCGHRVATSPDGITWTVRASPGFTTSARCALAVGSGLAVIVWGTGDSLYATSDFVTWRPLDLRMPYWFGGAGGSFNCLAYKGGGFFGGGQSGLVMFSHRTSDR